MDCTHEDLPTGNAEGHALVLVGIRKDQNNQTFFLLQNFWEGKQFVEVRQGYFMNSTGLGAAFAFFICKFNEVDVDHLYSERTGLFCIAQSSPLPERASQKSACRL